MKYHSVIVGAGFAGICMAIKLKQAGNDDFVILEKASDIGGTWFFNRYPGAACDVPSCVYSFSFEPNPNWSRHYVTQPEIEAYLHHCVKKYQLTDHIRCNAQVDSMTWNGDSWEIITSIGEQFISTFALSAVGQLNQPSMPDINGIDAFAGASFHSARWDAETGLQGKRVAVVGSAASAVQLIPEVAKVASHLRVFQRTPNYLIPRLDRQYLAIENWLFNHVPMVLAFYRWVIFNQGEKLFFPAMRRAKWAQRIMEKLAKWQLNRQVSDIELRKKLTPHYEIGCKRVLMCDDYYPALMRPNVSLETSPIEAITPRGVMSGGEEYDCDIIIYATGFKASQFLMGLDVTGRDGIKLHDKWAGSTAAYRSVCVAGFPNFFMLYGPNSNLGSNSIIAMIEAQVGYIVEAMQGVDEGALGHIEVTEEAQANYQHWLKDSLSGTVWMQDCQSWYKGADGVINNNWPWSVGEFQRHMAHVKWADFSI